MAERDLLADLTDAQREAVTHVDGPLLILAGAGSGKTRVITRRVAFLLHQGVHPGNILAITFTNKAAGEMRQRVEALMPGNRVSISTFHALGARLLRQYAVDLGLDRNFTIYDQTDRARVVKMALEDLNIDPGRFSPESVMGAISKAKNKLLSPERYAEQAHDFFSQHVARAYPVYEKRMRDANALDFDDLLYWPALALKHNQELRSELDARFRYVLIDEYQDTNQAQYEIARRLSVDHPNLCVVGDPDQCLLPGTLIDTPHGKRPIENLREGERVLSANGWGDCAAMWIDKVMVNPYKGRLVKVTVEGDIVVRATPNHMCFARLQATPQTHFVDRRYPHHRPGGVTRGTWARRNVLFTLFGDHRKTPLQPWHYHRVQMVTTGEEARVTAATRFSVRDGQRGSWRIETSRKHHSEAMQLADEIGSFNEGEVIYRARLTPDTTYPFMPAGHVHPGMLVPVLVDGRIVDRRVESVEWEDYEGPVFDLSVPETHNFSANGLIVHNSIYKFRGSDIRNILDFERDFPTARVLTLSMNYRSTKSILAAASGLIANNVQRKPKDLITENPSGQKVAVLTFETGVNEAEGIVRRIRQAVTAGKRTYRDFAILLRINALTRGLETAFVQQRVPFQIVKGLAFFDRKENRDVLAYLRLLLNPRDNVSFERVVNEPPRGIGKVSLEHLKAYAEANEISLLGACARAESITAIKGKAVKGLRDFGLMMQDLTQYVQAQPDEVIRQVLDRSGYRKMLKDSGSEEDQDRLANIEELITAAKQFAAEDNSHTITDFLENITLASDVDSWDQQQDCVAVMTMHAAKGLEFPVVFLAAVEQGLLPHERSLNKTEEIEEERRLAFVGMTRAKEELYLCHSRMRDFRGQTLYAVPSMFLNEVPPHVVEAIDLSSTAGRSSLDAFRGGGGPAAREGWAEAGVEVPLPVPPKPRNDEPYTPGMLVRHASYGVGRVVSLTGYGATRTVKVRFQTQGEHAFRISHVKLEVLGKGE